jgi:hypothetical protein
MRKGRRKVLLLSIALVLGVIRQAAPARGGSHSGAPDELAAITVELTWNAAAAAEAGPAAAPAGAAAPPRGLRLGVSEGRVLEVIEWPSERAGERPLSGQVDGEWDLGPVPSGRVRARLETCPGADIVVRWAGQAVRVPVAAVLERPQSTPAQAPLSVSVKRLPWDSLLMELGGGAEDGIAAPSAPVPLTVRYNILWPDTPEVMVRTTLSLRPIRGGDPVWKDEQRHATPVNRLEPEGRTWTLRAPASEGMYVLEVHAAWEPSAARESTRLGRLIRRRKAAPVASSATRRVLLAVVAPRTPEPASGEGSVPGREVEVDTLDLARLRGSRFVSQGRSPLPGRPRHAWRLPDEVLADAPRREHDRLRGWIGRGTAEAANLGPADDSGLAWSAIGLHVSHPDRPHRLTVSVGGGDPAALGVAIVDPGGNGRRPRVLLDACASGPPILGSGPAATFSWIVWPDCPEPLLVLLNRNPTAPVRLGTVRVAELDALPPPPIRLPSTPATRTLGLYLTGPHPLDRFGGDVQGQADPLQAARNLVSYLGYCGGSMVILPEGLAERHLRRQLQGQADENASGPDRLDLVLRLLRRQGSTAFVEMRLDGREAMPGLPPADSAEALRQGLVRIDKRGLADSPSYHPLHPAVRQAMKRRVEQAVARRDRGLSFDGVLLRLGTGPSLLGTPDSGLDDETYLRFVKETFGPETQEGIPGLSTTDPERFSARSKYLSGVGRMPWLTWRSRAIAALYTELEEAVRASAPGARLAIATPGLHSGAAGAEARRVDLAGLAPSQAWRSVGLDLDAWPAGSGSTIVLRGVELSEDPLARDLATSPDLDAKLAHRPHRGLLLTAEGEPDDDVGLAVPSVQATAGADDARAGNGSAGEAAGADLAAIPRASGRLSLSSLPLGDGISADEPLGHAVAALDAQWVILASSAVAGHEDRIRRFAAVLRALPAWPPRAGEAADAQNEFGVAVRALSGQGESFLEIANDTPYPIRLAGILEGPASAPVEDLGRNLRLIPGPVAGGRQLVVDVLPFGVSVIRVGAPGARLTGITPYPSEAVMTSMEARYRELSTQLARLNRGLAAGLGAPANPGFEPDPVAIRQAQNDAGPGGTASAGGQVAGGWTLTGPEGSAIAIDRQDPHGGAGSLKLSAPAAPASVLSGSFVPASASSMLIQAFLRADPAEARVRVWIEGEVAGQPFLRRSDVQVPPGWELRAVRAADLPAGGLDLARLRFELLTPGTLWIDDLRVLGEAAPEAVRLNAQRTLLAALQAYRAQRYAEFARLSSSHWARHPSLLASGRSSSPGPLSGPPAAGRPGPASASALSPDRTVR